MPASRGSRAQTRRTSGQSTALPHRRSQPLDTIEVFSSGDEQSPKVKNRVVFPDHHRKPPVTTGEIIDLTDSDESPSHTDLLGDLRLQLKTLQESGIANRKDCDLLRRELIQVKEENKSLRAASEKLDKQKLVLDISQLEDNLTCEICTLWMWEPYILPNCGHSFCKSCLDDWFTTTLAKFLEINPNYNLGRALPAHVRDLLSHPAILDHPQLTQTVFSYLPQQPAYTCPSCRVPVTLRPAEDFKLKALVRTAAAASGLKSPVKRGPPGKGKGTGANNGPWAGFFPSS